MRNNTSEHEWGHFHDCITFVGKRMVVIVLIMFLSIIYLFFGVCALGSA